MRKLLEEEEEEEESKVMFEEEHKGILKIEKWIWPQFLVKHQITTFSLQKPDPLLQLIQCFQRAATSEQKQAVPITEDKLYIAYASVLAQSVRVEEEHESLPDDLLTDAQLAVSFQFQFIYLFVTRQKKWS